MSKTVRVQTNAPANPEMTLKISGNIEIVAAFEPAYVNLKEVPFGKKQEFSARLVALNPEALVLSDLTSDRPEVLTGKIGKDKDGHKVDVTFTPNEKVGLFNGRITVKTNLESPKIVTLSVRGDVVGDLVPNPIRLIFTPGPPGKPPKPLVIRLTSRSKQPFRVLGIDDPADKVKTRYSRKKDAWEIIVESSKPSSDGSGTLEIRTDHKTEPVVKVTYNLASGKKRVQRHGGELNRQEGGRVGNIKTSPKIAPKNLIDKDAHRFGRKPPTAKTVN